MKSEQDDVMCYNLKKEKSVETFDEIGWSALIFDRQPAGEMKLESWPE